MSYYKQHPPRFWMTKWEWERLLQYWEYQSYFD